eukprot:g1852.t1 g1852   contig11:197524-200865(+)
MVNQQAHLRKLQTLRRMHVSNANIERAKDNLLHSQQKQRRRGIGGGRRPSFGRRPSLNSRRSNSRCGQQQQHRQRPRQVPPVSHPPSLGHSNNSENELYVYESDGDSSYEDDFFGQQQQQQHQLVHHSSQVITKPPSLPSSIQHSNRGYEEAMKPPSNHSNSIPSKVHTHPFTLPPNTKLTSRSDLWLVLMVSSAASLGSIAVSTPIRTSEENASLALISIVFCIATVVGCGYRYAPFRIWVTSSTGYTSNSGTSSQHQLPRFSRPRIETILAASTLLLQSVATSITTDPMNQIAISGSEVWNSNLFYGMWLGLYVTMILLGDLLMSTTTEIGGVVSRVGESNTKNVLLSTAATRVFFLLGSNFCSSGVLINLYSSVVCSSSFLDYTPTCTRALSSSLLSILGIVMCLIALGIHRVSMLGNRLHLYYNVQSFPMKYFDGEERAFKSSRLIGSILALGILVLNSMIVGLVSSPSGPGVELGSAFVASWVSLGAALMLFKTYCESYLMPLPSKHDAAPVRQVSLQDSFRSDISKGTTDTEALDDSYKLTDDERNEIVDREYEMMEHGSRSSVSMTHSEMMGRLASLADGTAANSSQERSRESIEPEESARRSFSSKSGPCIQTSPHSSDVSTLGQSRITQEPFGLKAGYSFHGGNDATVNDGGMSGVNEKEQYRRARQRQAEYSPVNVPQASNYDVPTEAPLNKGNPNRSFGRRSSYSSVPSLPMVNEATSSQEGTSPSQSGSGNSSGHRHGGNNSNTNSIGNPIHPPRSTDNRNSTRSKSFRSACSEKSKSTRASKSSTSRRAKHNQYRRRGSESSNSASSAPVTVDDEGNSIDQSPRQRHRRDAAIPRGRGASSKMQQHRYTSPTKTTSSDFDIVISDSSTVVTELTTEGFDDRKVATTNSADFVQLKTSNIAKGLPNRMPLYNGSDASTTSGNGGNADTYKSQTNGLNPHDISSVDELVATALKYARLSKSSGDVQAMQSNPLSEESLTGGPYGRGVSSDTEESAAKALTETKKKLQRNTSKSSMKRSSHKQRNSRGSNEYPRYIDDMGDQSCTTTSSSSLQETDLEETPARHSKPTANGCGVRKSRRGSMQSLYSENGQSYGKDLDVDYAC